MCERGANVAGVGVVGVGVGIGIGVVRFRSHIISSQQHKPLGSLLIVVTISVLGPSMAAPNAEIALCLGN